MASQLPTGLVDASEQVQDALRRADFKATSLLQYVGAAFVGVIALVVAAAAAAPALLWTAFGLIFTAVLLLLAAIHPRLSRDPAPGTWLYAARVGPATLLATYNDPAAIAMATATNVCRNAKNARCKFRIISTANLLLFAGLISVVLALLVAAVTR